MSYDPDQPDPRYLLELEKMLTQLMDRINQQILHPTGATPESIEWNQNRAIQVGSQIAQMIQDVKKKMGVWTGKALSASASEGWAAAQRQIDALRKSGGTGPLTLKGPVPLQFSFNLLNRDVITTLARDTYADVAKGLDHTGQVIQGTLKKMADNGMTAKDVNQILAGSIVEGKPKLAITQIKSALEAIHGKTITFPSGKTMEVGGQNGYARMLARTRLRSAHVTARHARLQADGIHYVVIIGNITKYPCTAFLGKIYYIGAGTDPTGKYPRLDTLESNGYPAPPFHPNCSKTTAPIVIEYASPEQLAEGEPDDTSEQMAKVGANTYAGTLLMKSSNAPGQAVERMTSISKSIRSQARANGYSPPPWCPSSKDLKEVSQ